MGDGVGVGVETRPGVRKLGTGDDAGGVIIAGEVDDIPEVIETARIGTGITGNTRPSGLLILPIGSICPCFWASPQRVKSSLLLFGVVDVFEP